MEENSRKLVFRESADEEQRHQEYKQLMATLKELSLSEIDYEMRTLMLVPSNISGMARFFDYILTLNEDYDLKIVYYYRFLSLLGTSVIQNPDIHQKVEKWEPISQLYEYTSEVIERVTLKGETE